MYVCIVRRTSRTRAVRVCGQKACDLTTRAILDTEVSSLFVTCSEHGYFERSLKPSEDKKDRLRRRRERENL